ncbi:MAG: hypothetical protein WC740_18700, partial [Verrucomicrobiia bacterium]
GRRLFRASGQVLPQTRATQNPPILSLVPFSSLRDSQTPEPLDSPTAFMLNLAERVWLGDRAGILCDTAEALAQAGEASQARKVCQLALDAAEAINRWNETSPSGGLSYVRPLGRVAAVLARTGGGSRAMSVTTRIYALDRRSYGITRDKWEALCGIADGFTQAGDSKQARRVCLQALKLAEKLKKRPEFKGVDRDTELLNICDAADHAGDKAWILGRIAGSLAKAGDPEQAKAICEQALNWTSQIKMQPDQIAIQMHCAHSKSYALSSIAIGLAQAGDKKKALEVCRQALQTASMIVRPDGEDATTLFFRLHSTYSVAQEW